ncbi:DUF3179 domain-containing protein [bacterium]|nr:DUF3179 domain-containing protein [bacterium]
MKHRLGLMAGIAVTALIVSACGGAAAVSDPEPSATETTGTPSTSTTTVPSEDPITTTSKVDDGLPSGPSALVTMFADEFPDPLVDPAAIRPGGPPPDGIPPIDEPEFISIAEADAYLFDEEAVVALEIDGDARAYPAQILIWHEFVNDSVGGVPVSITYCPLCNSAVTYERVVRGVETTFGTSGRLYNSALVMYDRATETLWTHFDGTAVVGILAGDILEPIGSPLLSWGDFKEIYPGGTVLDRDRTGAVRRYGTNPYAGYDDPLGNPFLFAGPLDDRARAQLRVIGIEVDGKAAAYSINVVRDVDAGATATPVTVGGTDLVVLWSAGQASALDTSEIEGGRDVGTVGVFVPEVDGARLTFSADSGVFVDQETGSRWTVAGTAVDGPLAGSKLERVPHLDTFWFAWSTYKPGTDFIEE